MPHAFSRQLQGTTEIIHVPEEVQKIFLADVFGRRVGDTLEKDSYILMLMLSLNTSYNILLNDSVLMLNIPIKCCDNKTNYFLYSYWMLTILLSLEID